jgi:proteasome lid subunit RPN8/RPN11
VPDFAIHTLRLSPALRDEIMVHLIREAPNEGVGLLAVDRRGTDAEAVAFFPGENIDASPTRYTMHPRDVVTALDTIAERGWSLGAIVHSHLNGPATPSRTDIGEAYYPDTVMLIVSLAHLPPEMRGWWLDDRGDARVMRPVVVQTGEEGDEAPEGAAAHAAGR